MNQIERVEECSYTLRLWSDAAYEIDTSKIKSLLNLAIQRLGFYSQIDARYSHFERRWQIRFCWQSESSGRQSFEQILDDSQLVCANPVFLERLAFDLGDRIRRSTAPDDSQNWVIVKYREEHFAKIHQAGKRSINLILYEVTQEGDLSSNHTTVTIRARIPSDAIRRNDGVEIGGMLLQGELLGWVEDGQQGWFLFSPNTQQVNTSHSWADEPRITFTTRPITNRLAYFERIRQMFEQGQIEIPRSGYFDQILMDYPRHGDRARIVMPFQMPGIEPSGVPLQELRGRLEVERLEVMFPIPNAINAIGDVSCEYNAKSQYLRCTVNPCGPCEGCQHYEKI
ncbi:hypothetical protein FD723_18610 [Nostoc sp. C052]|nr:hypothetical protein FD723_18610 [Nostoc sp. C052]